MRGRRNRWVPGMGAVALVVAGACGPNSAPLLEGEREVVAAASTGDGEAVRRLLDHERPAVRVRATLAAVGLGDPATLGPLTRLLRDPEPRVREAAAFALGFALGFAPDGEPSGALRGALAREDDPAVREALIRAMGRGGSAADAPRLVALGGRDRRAATEALAYVALRGGGTREVVDTLVARLSSDDAREAAFAARGLVWSGAADLWIRHRAGIRGVLASLPRDGAAARVLLRGFGRLLPRGELESWALDAPDPRTRLAAVEALATHSDGVLGVSALERAVDDADETVARAAQRGLAALGRGAEPPAAAGASSAPSTPGPDVAPVRGWTADDWQDVEALGAAPRLALEFPGHGTVVVELDPRGAPAAVLHLVRRARAGAYDGVRILRVVPGAAVQWGRDGVGEGATAPERRPLPVDRGTVALARDGAAGDDDLFVALDRLPELDGAHTVVGRVVEGLAVLESLEVGAVMETVRGPL